MDNNTDDAPALSNEALTALEEFYADRDARDKLFEDLASAATNPDENSSLTMDAFAEDWNESQFWYSKETATVLANQLLADSTAETTIAIISAPSVFIELKNLLVSITIETYLSTLPIELAPLKITQARGNRSEMHTPKIFLLEFDQRFSVFPEFIHYDFREPLKLPAILRGSVDNIICDPPFLSEDCQTKAALTVRWLSKFWSAQLPVPAPTNGNRVIGSPSRLIVCTGERMETLVKKLYRPKGIATTTFMPVHEKGLSNEFYCYANFECNDWDWNVR